MAISSNAPVSLTDIQTEFGGTSPISLSEYYSVATGIPSSGEISMGQFRGTAASATIDANRNYQQIVASDYISSGGTLTIPSTTVIFSDDPSIPALKADVANATIVNNGQIMGRGGNGSTSGNGADGGPAITITANGTIISNRSGAYIAGGGGGGGGSAVASGAGLRGGGGGGAGGGDGGNGGYNNLSTAGGNGGAVGAFGTAGSAGGNITVNGKGGGQGGGGGSIFNVQSGTGYSNDRGGGGGGGGRRFVSHSGAGGTGYSYDGNAANGGAGGSGTSVGSASSPSNEKGGGGGGGGWGAAGGNGSGTTGGAGGDSIHVNSGITGYYNNTGGYIYGTNDATEQFPFADGTNYVSNGSATSSLTSNYGTFTLHKTVWDYQQSGNIWTFTVASNATGSLRIRSTADPDSAPRNNSGNDRVLRLRRNGSQVGSATAVASNNAVLDKTINVSGGDVLTMYMDNSFDWRDLGGFERIKNIYITGS